MFRTSILWVLLLFTQCQSGLAFLAHPKATTSKTPFDRNRVSAPRLSTAINDKDDRIEPSLPVTLAALVGTSASWCIISWNGLMYHPTASVAAGLCLRHNLFTVAQALAFPLPVMTVSFLALRKGASTTAKRLSLGIAMASLWTAAAVFWCPTFSVGYNLFSNQVRYTCALIHTFTAIWTLSLWKRQNNTSISTMIRGSVSGFFSLLSPKDDDAALFSASSLGLFMLAFLPQLVAFPSATIPTLLGKRLSRAASGFTFLGAVAVLCLKEEDSSLSSSSSNKSSSRLLRRGLAIGALGQLGLVVAKVVGLDGGGLLLPGKGLWELYPSLVKASGAATFLMMMTYSILAFATLTT